jgi:hypothetical protein
MGNWGAFDVLAFPQILPTCVTHDQPGSKYPGPLTAGKRFSTSDIRQIGGIKM